MSFQDRQDDDPVRLDTVDDPIGADEDLPDSPLPEFGDNAASARVDPSFLRPVDQLVDPCLSCTRIVAGNVKSDLFQIGGSLRGEINPHAQPPGPWL